MAENIEVSVSENNGATDRLTTAVLQLAAAADRLEASAARGAAGTRGLGDAANNAQSGVGSLTRALGATQSAFGALQGYAGSFLALLSTQKIIEYGDAYTGLQNKLKLVTKDSEQMGKATQEIFRISQATRADLLGSATAYARISTSLKGMNRDTKDAGPILTTLNQAIALSGSTGAAAKSGLEQFQQALNRGVLRGQEFTSVAIGLPAVAAAIAEGLNKPVAALKGMADQGMLTSTKVLGALEKSAAAVQRAFAQSTPTVAQGFTVLQNAFTMWLGTANEGSGASNRLSNTLMFLGDNMNIVAPIAIGLAGVLTLGAVIIPATVAVYGMITALGGLAVSMIAATAAFLVTPFGMVFAAGVIIATTAIVAFWDKIKELTAGIPILGAAVQALTGFFGGNKDAADKTKTSHGSLSDKLKEVFAQFGTLTGGISTATKQHGEEGIQPAW
jgi:tape measure domain-containing protein